MLWVLKNPKERVKGLTAKRACKDAPRHSNGNMSVSSHVTSLGMSGPTTDQSQPSSIHLLVRHPIIGLVRMKPIGNKPQSSFWESNTISLQALKTGQQQQPQLQQQHSSPTIALVPAEEGPYHRNNPSCPLLLSNGKGWALAIQYFINYFWFRCAAGQR